jgi:hypothetical protein
LIVIGRNGSGEIEAIIQSLLYFPDPRAQAAAEEFAAPYDKDLVSRYRKEIKEKGVRALFEW